MGFALQSARAARTRAPARLALAFGLSCCLAACGAWKGPSPATSLPRKIQVMASDGWIYDVMGENAKLFEKETGIKVSFTIYAPHVYFRALQTMLASGEAADIFLMQSTRWYLGQRDRPGKVVHRPDGGGMDETPEAGMASRRLVQGPRLRPDRLGRYPGMGLHLQRQDLPAAGPLRAADVRGVRGGLRADQAGRHRAHLRARGQPLAHVPHVLRDGLHVRAARPRPL